MAIISNNSWALPKHTTSIFTLRKTLRSVVAPIFLWHSNFTKCYPIILEAYDFHYKNPDYVKDFYNGHITLEGYKAITGAHSPFNISPPHLKWAQALHSFSWLRHFDSAKTELAQAYARNLLQDWFNHASYPLNSVAWQIDIVAKRLIAWLAHSNMLYQHAPLAFQRKFLKSVNTQLNYLQKLVTTSPKNAERLEAYIALAFGAICLDLPKQRKKHIYFHLSQSLNYQIYPDGGHLSRNPALLLNLLTYLLALKESFNRKGENGPIELIYAIERLFPALRFFLHSDQSLARFNGVGPLNHKHLQKILALDESQGQTLSYAPHSGYKRLQYQQTIILADIGKAPNFENAHFAHAGCLSFEMSSKGYNFIVNAGISPTNLPNYDFLGRVSAAHSVGTLNDHSTGIFTKNNENNDKPYLMKGPNHIDYKEVSSRDWEGFVARHDFYQKEFGILYERGLLLHKEGRQIEGYDFFQKTQEKNQSLYAIIRFHLHPDIEASFNGKGQVHLEAPNHNIWLFSSPNNDIFLEDSVFFADINGPRQTKQILLKLDANKTSRIQWRLVNLL